METYKVIIGVETVICEFCAKKKPDDQSFRISLNSTKFSGSFCTLYVCNQHSIVIKKRTTTTACYNILLDILSLFFVQYGIIAFAKYFSM